MSTECVALRQKDLQLLFKKIEQSVPFTQKDLPTSVQKTFKESLYLIRNNELNEPGMSVDLTPFQAEKAKK